MVRGTTCTWRCGTDWLTTLLMLTHEPCDADGLRHRGRAPLHRPNSGSSELRGELGERHDVRARHDQQVTLEHRPPVEERDDVGFVEHDLGRHVTADECRRTRHAAATGAVGAR